MDEMAKDATWWNRKRVAFTGRLASMTRAEAADLVRSLGGEFVRHVAADTQVLVVGQDGWPLRSDGRLTRSLRQVRKLQLAGAAIAVLSEDEMLARLPGGGPADGVRRRYTAGQISELLHVRSEQLRAWTRLGLIQPVETVLGVPQFDFCQVAGARTICRLARRGVSLDRICRSLRQLHRWTATSHPLAQLAVLERDGSLLVRLATGQLAEPTGQLHFDYPAESARSVVAVPQDHDSLFESAWHQEQSGRWCAAAAAYRQVLAIGGPSATVSFNLGNVHCQLGQWDEALQCYRQAVELAPGFAAAWNNLGNVLTELGRYREAVAAYQKGLHLSPDYAAVHYNLADTLDQAGRAGDAQRHWRLYLRLEPAGHWADYARGRMVQRMTANSVRGL
jgi:tetratricopeptide (TPR) repeat protein